MKQTKKPRKRAKPETVKQPSAETLELIRKHNDRGQPMNVNEAAWLSDMEHAFRGDPPDELPS